jgi:RNA polymerase-binding transcription factor DksA
MPRAHQHNRGLGLGDEPDAGELAEIERLKAEIRPAIVAKQSAGGRVLRAGYVAVGDEEPSSAADGAREARREYRRATRPRPPADPAARLRHRYRGIAYQADCVERPWHAQISHDYARIDLGHFPTAEEAARAYDEAARRLGRADRLNFPTPEEQARMSQSHAPARNGVAAVREEGARIESDRARDTSLGACPACGTPYGKRRRCFVCSPGGRPRGDRGAAAEKPPASRPPIAAPTPATIVRHAPVEQPPPSPPAPARSAAVEPASTAPAPASSPRDPELDAMHDCYRALDGLDAVAIRRALAWVGGRLGIDPTIGAKGGQP